jgi:hypothetical protein
MIEKFKQMAEQLTQLDELIRLIRIDEEYLRIIKDIEHGKK